MVAFLYQRSGRPSLSENELANAASLDLKWYAPKAARALIAGLVRAGWLVRDEDGELTPAFDIKTVKVPMTFRPPPSLPNEVPPPGAFQAASDDAPRRSPGGARMETDAVPRHRAGTGSGAEGSAASRPVPASDAPHQAPDDTDPGSIDTDPGGSPAETPDSADDDPTMLGRILAALTETSGEGPEVWVARMDAVVQRTDDGLDPEVALLLAAAKEGVDVGAWLEAVRPGT